MRSFKLTFLFFILFSGSFFLSAQLTTAGDMMFIGFDADVDDGFAIVTLVEIPANSTVYFTDNEWDGGDLGSGGSFNTGERIFTWNTGSIAITSGTVVTFTSIQNSSRAATIGAISSTGSGNLGAEDEVLYAYTGTSPTDPTIILSAISNEDFTIAGSIAGTGLTSGLTAIEFTEDEDVMVYTGSTDCSGTIADCQAQISNTANWGTDDGTGTDQSQDGLNVDFPDDVTSSFGGSLLPVELIAFDGDQSGLISWSTATETNNSGFEVQKSIDGVKFESIGFVEGFGNTADVKNYSFQDEHLIQSSYYRLKQVDFDGAFEYSEIIYVQFLNQRYWIYPNPISSTVDLNLPEGFYRFIMTDLSGKTLELKNASLEAIKNAIRAASKGSHRISIQNKDLAHTQMVIRN